MCTLEASEGLSLSVVAASYLLSKAKQHSVQISLAVQIHTHNLFISEHTKEDIVKLRDILVCCLPVALASLLANTSRCKVTLKLPTTYIEQCSHMHTGLKTYPNMASLYSEPLFFHSYLVRHLFFEDDNRAQQMKDLLVQGCSRCFQVTVQRFIFD